MAETLYPVGYGTTLISLDRLRDIDDEHFHPAYARRLFAWIEAQGGLIGIGDGWRKWQPSKPGFAPAGKSFHQNQRFASGFVGCCAVDLVARNGNGQKHRSPTWLEVPRQGSADAVKWGLHANVTGEPWHLQPREIDGWQTWVDNGRRDPVLAYPLPKDDPPDPPDTGGFLMSLTPAEQKQMYGWAAEDHARIQGALPGPYSTGERPPAPGPRRFALDDQDGSYIVSLLERIAAKLEA